MQLNLNINFIGGIWLSVDFTIWLSSQEKYYDYKFYLKNILLN